VKFPLYSMDGSRLTSLKGEVSFFSKVNLSDIEQMDSLELDSYFSSIKGSLISLEGGGFTKIYNQGGDVFLNSTKLGLDLRPLNLTEFDDPMKQFFCDDLRSSIDIFEDYLVFNSHYKRIISVSNFSSEIELSELQDLSDYVLLFRKIDNQSSKRKLDLKRKMHFGRLFDDMKNIESENAYNETQDLLEDITNQNESLFEIELYFIVHGKDKTDLDLNTDKLISNLKEIEIDSRIESRALGSVFQSLIPGVSPLFLRKHLAPASFVCALFPLRKDFVHSSGIELISRRGYSLYLDMFEKTSHNFNMLITGSSGQGKSMMANKILLEGINNGIKGVVLDLGSSFLKTTKYLGGDIVSEKINPFISKDPVYLTEFVLSFVDGEVDQLQKGKLFKEIKNNLSITNFKEFIKALERSFDNLGLYFEDCWQYFSEDELLNESLLYCDLSKYSKRIKRPLIIYLIECFKKMDGRKIFIFDECWNLLNENADYIAECFRTFRKHDASAIAISQNIDDFSKTELGKVIIQNTFYKLLFRQTISDKVFLSNYEKELISDLRSQKGEYSEFLVLSEEVRKISRFYPSYLEYELFTSDRNDCIEFDSYLDNVGRFFSFKRCVQNFVADKYRGGNYAL